MNDEEILQNEGRPHSSIRIELKSRDLFLDTEVLKLMALSRAEGAKDEREKFDWQRKEILENGKKLGRDEGYSNAVRGIADTNRVNEELQKDKKELEKEIAGLKSWDDVQFNENSKLVMQIVKMRGALERIVNYQFKERNEDDTYDIAGAFVDCKKIAKSALANRETKTEG
jgi:hypothetical protein